MKTANPITLDGDHRHLSLEWVALGVGLLVAALSVHISSVVQVERRSVSVELPGWGVWAMVIGVAAVAAPRLIRWRRRSATSRSHESEQAASVGLNEAPAAATDAAGYARHLLVRQPGAIQLVDISSIRWIEADGRYVRIHATSGRHLAQYTLVELRGRLDPALFVQIHRSTIVNVHCIRALHTSDYRDFDVTLDDASKLRLSRTFRENLEAALGSRL